MVILKDGSCSELRIGKPFRWGACRFSDGPLKSPADRYFHCHARLEFQDLQERALRDAPFLWAMRPVVR
jgi:hypothetical protein